MSLHSQCSEEMICRGTIGYIFNIIEKSQRGGTKNGGGTKQVLLKLARNLSSFTRRLQCKLAEALEAQDMSPLKSVVKDPESYIHSELITEYKEEGSDTRTVQRWTSLYWEKHYWDAHVEFILQRTLGCDKCANDELLVEWLGIIGNLTHDDLPAGVQWHDLLRDNESDMVQLFHSLLHPSCHDDIKLELIILLGTLCSSEECSHWVASNNLINNIIHNTFVEENLDVEIRLQILSIYERLMLYEVTRFQIIGGDGEYSIV